MVKRLRDWVCTIPLLVAIGATLVGLHPAVRIAGMISYDAMGRVIVVLERALVRWFRVFCRARIEVEMADGYEPGRPYVYVGNHQSNFDIPLIGAFVGTPAPKFTPHHRLQRWIPFVSYVIRRGGYAPVDRERPRETLRAIRDMAREAAASGVGMVIFPESKRARDGELLPFQPAGTSTMLQAAPEMAVVPVAIDGCWSLMAHGLFPTPYGHRVRIRFHEPISREPGDAAEVLARSREVIAGTLVGWRAAGVVGERR